MSVKLKITAHGQGPELVLVHGWAMHSGVWRETLAALRGEFRVNLVDLPGHGINHDVPLGEDLYATADLLLAELPPASWIGWSLGGLITMAAALSRPERIHKMVLVATTPSFIRRDEWPCGMEASIMQAFTTGLEVDLAGTLRRFLALQTIGSDTARATLQRLRSTAFGDHPPAKSALQGGLHLLHSSNLVPRLRGCNVPALFFGGSEDRLVNPQALHLAAASMPCAAVQIINGAGHAPFITQPKNFVESLRGFLGKEKAA